MSRKKRSRRVVVRSKASYRTARRAMRSLEDAGYPPHVLSNPQHTGNYWRWEVRS